MARFRVEVSNTDRKVYEVEAKTRSHIHDQFDDFIGTDAPAGWFLVSESYGEEEVTWIRDLLP